MVTRREPQTPAFASALRRSRYDENVLYAFKGGPDSGYPYASLIFDKNGALYGTSYGGGTHYFGSAFKLTPTRSGYTESVLWSFDNGNGGGQPYAGLTLGKNGALYGTTPFPRGGLVFKLTPSGSHYVESIVWTFDDGYPYGTLIFDKKGAMYGTTSGGGTYGGGTVFKLTSSGSGYNESILHSFCAEQACADGGYPIAGVVFGTDGALYGTTFLGGTGSCIQDGQNKGCGTVFKVMPSGSGFSNLYNFTNSPDGAYPTAGVIVDTKGTVYGTTTAGGNAGAQAGTVFRLTPSGSGYTEDILHTFTGGADGGNPNAGLAFGKKGALYGTTWGGGYDDAGIVFKLVPPRYDERVLHRFIGGADGRGSMGGLIFDKKGALYGATSDGGGAGCGSLGCGTVFKLTP